jgi:hypothetical protein
MTNQRASLRSIVRQSRITLDAPPANFLSTLRANNFPVAQCNLSINLSPQHAGIFETCANEETT